MGGTFDYLHVGHKLLLSSALLLLKPEKELVIGLTGDGLLKNKKNKEYM
jgi:phosphopantetheine adenylyltransferase